MGMAPQRAPGSRLTTLDRVRPGTEVRVVAIADPAVRQQALRLGIGPGTRLTCNVNTRWGPVVVRSGARELAFGRPLARLVVVAMEGG